MVDYKSLGLVNTREMFKRAINGGYAIPAFNFNNMEQLQAIIKIDDALLVSWPKPVRTWNSCKPSSRLLPTSNHP